MKRKLLAGAGLAGAAALLTASPAFAAGPDELLASDVQIVMNNLWIFIAAVLVLFMQAGFALVEAGLTRSKSVGNIMMKNLMDCCAGVLAFYVIGFSIAYGSDKAGGLFGWDGLTFTRGFEGSGLTPSTFFFFQVVFAATAATIVSGAMAERTKFKSYFVYSLVITAFIYPVVVHWTWGGGWLAMAEDGSGNVLKYPFSDFAGSTVVHSVGGWAALMGAIILGPRLGKFKGGKPQAIPGHNIPFVILGTLILFVGWFGFNPGSELAADLVVMDVAVTTLLAACAGGVASMVVVWLSTGKPDVGMTANGVLAGLVSITAPTAAVTNGAAIAIGAIGGALVVGAVFFIERKLKIDDPVGAISVHGICGAWGTLSVGLFATKDDAFLGREDAGLFYGGGFDQLFVQAVMVLSVFAFVTVTAGLLFLAIKKTIGLRVTEEEELAGLDVEEHGYAGYGEGFGQFIPGAYGGGAGVGTKSPVMSS